MTVFLQQTNIYTLPFSKRNESSSLFRLIDPQNDKKWKKGLTGTSLKLSIVSFGENLQKPHPGR